MIGIRDYERKPVRDEVLVGCLASPGGLIHRDRDQLNARLAAAGQRFGFQTAFGPSLGALPATPPERLAHLIAVTDAPFDAKTVEWLEQALSHWGSASVAFAYPGDQAMYAAEGKVEACKRQFGARLNFLFPDSIDGGVRYVSEQKIIDNSVCDTVRVKYIPHRVAAGVELPAAVRRGFEAASATYAGEHLFLRAPTDGYIAVRHGAGFFITATFTSKVDLDLRRISFVHAYDRASNTLTYSGAYLPSSDAVEAAIVFAQCADIELMLHTHASKLFTRNPAYATRVLVPQLPYGEAALGDALAAALARTPDGFVIMEQHGDIFAGRGEPDALMDKVRARCREARAALA